MDGEMLMAPAPTPEHQWRTAKVYRYLDAFVENHQLGVVLFAPVDVLITRVPLRVRQPDILYISSERLEGKSMLDALKQNPLETAPDLVVKILSPSNTRIDMEEKCVDYGKIDVRECWLVSPEACAVEVLRFSSGMAETIGLYGTGATVHSEALPGLQLPVNRILT
jgi:Uma2 family endonuclease